MKGSGLFSSKSAVTPVFIATNKNITDAVHRYWVNDKYKKEYGPIGTWDVSRVTDMDDLFKNKWGFNEPLNDWDVSNVNSMKDMFKGASSFNQPLDKWDVSNVTNMNGMFWEASSFNQDLRDWNIDKAKTDTMFLWGRGAMEIKNMPKKVQDDHLQILRLPPDNSIYPSTLKTKPTAKEPQNQNSIFRMTSIMTPKTPKVYPTGGKRKRTTRKRRATRKATRRNTKSKRRYSKK